MKPKTTSDWRQRFECSKPLQIKTLEKPFADIPAGASMVIVTPKMVDAVVRRIPRGGILSLPELRKALAKEHGADFACAVTTGIALRVVAEFAYSQGLENPAATDPTPFWRAVDPKSPLAAKLTCGKEFLLRKRREECPR